MPEKIMRLSFYLLFCLTPFIFTKFNSELFEFNKMMFVYALTVVTTGTWVLRMISEKRLIWRRTILDIPLVLFLLSQIISTIFSIDQHTSIWGYYSRSNGGLLSTVSYILLYFAFVSNFEKSDVVKFLKGAVFAGGLVSLYAIPEHFGVSPSCIILTSDFGVNCWVQDVQARVFGTIGQPNWLAAYLAMLIFPAIYFFITAKSNFSKTCYLLLFTCYYLAFTFTYSRGTTLGFFAGFILLSISYLASHLKGVKLNSQSLKSFLVIVAGVILINLYFGSALTSFKLEKTNIAARPSIIQNQPSPGTQLENGGTESGKIRLIVWKGALEIFKANPLFGSGVETFAYAYYKFRPAEHNLVSEWDFLYNKAHNEYLNYLATTGLFGFLSYLAIIFIFLLWSIEYQVSSIKQKNHDSSFLLLASVTAGYISFLIQNFFLFSVVIISVFFYIFPAFAFVYLEKVKELSEKNIIAQKINHILELIGRKNLLKKFVQVLVIIIILVFLNSIFSLWEADTYYKKGTDYNDIGNPGRAYNLLIQAVSLNSKEPLYLSELGNAAASSAIALSSEDATTSGELADDSVFFTDLALSISPSNTTILRTAIRTYFQLTLLDSKYEAKTLETVNRSIDSAPTDPKLLLNKAIILTQLQKQDEAIKTLLKAIELKPNYREARLQLGDLYVQTGEKDLAKQEAEYVLNIIPNDPDALKLLEQLK